MSDYAAKLKLSFEAGTILVEGLPENDTKGIPGLKRDPRSGLFRAEGMLYREIIEYLIAKKIPYVYSARAYSRTP